jgi:hypothetical protein
MLLRLSDNTAGAATTATQQQQQKPQKHQSTTESCGKDQCTSHRFGFLWEKGGRVSNRDIVVLHWLKAQDTHPFLDQQDRNWT